MEQSSLLTSNVIDISQLSQEDVRLLDELTEDVHKWPLLLSLITVQLYYSIKRRLLSNHKAIHNALLDKGLRAYDNYDTDTYRSRKYAVKACLKATLGLLTTSLANELKILILFNASLHTAVLHILWNITEHKAREVVGKLWAYGLIQFTDIVSLPHDNTQHCAEAHAVISQYVIECINP